MKKIIIFACFTLISFSLSVNADCPHCDNFEQPTISLEEPVQENFNDYENMRKHNEDRRKKLAALEKVMKEYKGKLSKIENRLELTKKDIKRLKGQPFFMCKGSHYEYNSESAEIIKTDYFDEYVDRAGKLEEVSSGQWAKIEKTKQPFSNAAYTAMLQKKMEELRA